MEKNRNCSFLTIPTDDLNSTIKKIYEMFQNTVQKCCDKQSEFYVDGELFEKFLVIQSKTGIRS